MDQSTIMLSTSAFFLGFGVSHYLYLRDKRRHRQRTATDCAVLTYVLNHVSGDKNQHVRSFVVKHLDGMDINIDVLNCLQTTPSDSDEDDSDSEYDTESVASAVICTKPSKTEIISRYEDFIEDLVKLSSGEVNSTDLLNAIQDENVDKGMMDQLLMM